MRDDTYLTVEQAASTVQVAPETIRRWLRQGRLPGARPGGKRAGWRIAAADLAALLRPHGRRAPEPPAPVPVNHGDARRSAALGAVLAQAEQARDRGDAEGAARFEAMAASLVADDVQ